MPRTRLAVAGCALCFVAFAGAKTTSAQARNELAPKVPQPATAAAPAQYPPAASARDGSHDFDFLVGSWKFHLKRLARRLVGSTDWVEFDGTTVCQKVLDGRAEIEEMNVENPEKHTHIQGLALRLYNPQSHQWSIYWVNGADGILEPNPMVGEFINGRGEFYNQQVYEGKTIYARFVWTDTTTSKPHFEQSFSTDGGKTWEVNWITDQTREKP